MSKAEYLSSTHCVVTFDHPFTGQVEIKYDEKGKCIGIVMRPSLPEPAQSLVDLIEEEDKEKK